MATQPAVIQHRFMCVKQDPCYMYTQARARTHARCGRQPPHSPPHVLWLSRFGRALDAYYAPFCLAPPTSPHTDDKRKTGTHLAATFTGLPWTLFALPLSSNKHAACTRSRRSRVGVPPCTMQAGNHPQTRVPDVPRSSNAQPGGRRQVSWAHCCGWAGNVRTL
jgi:hypothetical protein